MGCASDAAGMIVGNSSCRWQAAYSLMPACLTLRAVLTNLEDTPSYLQYADGAWHRPEGTWWLTRGH